MDSPVDGSAIPYDQGLKSLGRNWANDLMRPPNVLDVAAFMKMRPARLVNIIGGLDMESTPPAIPTSVRPVAMASCTEAIAEVPLMQLSVTVND